MSYEIEVVSQPNARTGGYTARASAKGEQCFKDDMSENVARNTAKANLTALLERKEMLSKPSAIFNQEFIPSEHDDTEIQFDFGVAVRKLKEGRKVARKGWNGSGMFVYYVPAASYPMQRNNLATMGGVFPNDMVPYREYLALKTAQNDVSTWAPSVSDALATDWQLIK